MNDQHWFFFKNLEPSDYDEFALAVQRLGAESVDEVFIRSSVTGCFDNGERLVMYFLLRGVEYVARWRESLFWWMSGEKQRELYSVRQWDKSPIVQN